MDRTFPRQIIYFLGIIMLFIFLASLYRFQSYIDYSGDFWKMLKSASGLMFIWYGVAFLLYSFIASDSEKTKTTNYRYSSGKTFSITKNTGEIIPGDEDFGKAVFKIWWLLFPIYYTFWKELKSISKHSFTEYPNLNLVIKIIFFGGSFALSIYVLFKLNQIDTPRLIIRILMYGFAILYGILLIWGILKWTLLK